MVEAIGEALSPRTLSPENVFNFISLLKSLAKTPEAIELIGKKAGGVAV